MSDTRDREDGLLAIPEYEPGSGVALTDAQRWPTLTLDGAGRLAALAEHQAAPSWTHRTGDRLTGAAARRAKEPLPTDDWLAGHLAVARALPAYRDHAGPLDTLADFPTITRQHLMADIAAFVPLGADLDSMVEGTSSGSTGAALIIPDHVEEVARSFVFLAGLAREQGAQLRFGPDRLALAHLVNQPMAYSYASSVSVFGHATMARVNLHETAWPGADERERLDRRAAFLRAQDPQLITGAPASLEPLLDPPLARALRPEAIVSSATALSPALRRDLAATFRCPVLDLYGLHETRPLAVSADGGPHRIVGRRVFVEIMDQHGRSLPEGERGEIVVTAGENPYLPLVRYRTGDYGRLVALGPMGAIADLEGREDTRFAAEDGREVPCVELTQQLQRFGARGWSVRQDGSGRVAASVVGGDAAAIADALSGLLGRRVEIEQRQTLAELGPGKPRRYTRTA